MTAFIITATVMLAAALGWILVPLLRRGSGPGLAQEASNLAILRDQQTELDADLANGTITKAHYDQARRELEQRVLEDTKAAPSAAAGPIPLAGAWTAAIVAGALPIAAMLLYVTLGSHEAFSPAARTTTAAGDGTQHELTPERVAEMAAQLAARLEKNPDDAQGWIVLAHTYYSMKRFPEAVAAYDRAVKLAPVDADLLADYADALAATQQTLNGKPMELVERALQANPTQWKALALAGTAAFDRKDFQQAVAYWERLRQTLPPDSEMGRSIEASIAEARSLGGIAAGVAPSLAAASPAAATAPGTPAKPAGPAKAAAATAGGTIAGTVTLSPALAASAGPGDSVFIFARAAQGPKLPLAVVRKQVKDLPVTFALDDSMAMAPEMKLSNFAEVVVGARVTKTGNAVPQSGDFEGFSKPVKLGTSGLAIVIDTTRP